MGSGGTTTQLTLSASIAPHRTAKGAMMLVQVANFRSTMVTNGSTLAAPLTFELLICQRVNLPMASKHAITAAP